MPPQGAGRFWKRRAAGRPRSCAGGGHGADARGARGPVAERRSRRMLRPDRTQAPWTRRHAKTEFRKFRNWSVLICRKLNWEPGNQFRKFRKSGLREWLRTERLDGSQFRKFWKSELRAFALRMRVPLRG